jgi:peptide-methionine (S)-S-oxide reductase
MDKATFAAGCFWGVEAAFSKVNGITATMVGYSGGRLENPNYKDVCTGRTGHAESIQLEYDSSVVSYEEILEIFWGIHDPTTPNRQGSNVGSQYRSIIFYHNEKQKKTALASKERLNNSGKYSRLVVTEIVPASTFYKGEEYHQKYFKKVGGGNCRI